MPTTSDVVARALRQLQVSSVDEGPSDEMLAEGIKALNEMMHSWAAQGADVSHTDLTLTDTFSLPDKHVRATVMLLAQYIAPEYRVAPPDKLETDTLWSALQADYWTDPVVMVDEGLTDMPSQQRYGYGRTNNA